MTPRAPLLRSLALAVLSGVLANIVVVTAEQLLLLPWHHKTLIAHPMSLLGAWILALANGTPIAIAIPTAVLAWLPASADGARRHRRIALVAVPLIAVLFVVLVALPSTAKPSLLKLAVHLVTGTVLAVIAVGVAAAAVARRRRAPMAAVVVAAVLAVLAVNLVIFPHLYVRHHIFLATLGVTWTALALHRVVERLNLSRQRLVVLALTAAILPLAGWFVTDPYARYLNYRLAGYGKITGNFVDIARSRLVTPRKPKPVPDPRAATNRRAPVQRARWVVVLLVDTLRSDRVFSETPAAPALARRAATGRVFERAYAQWTCTEHSLLSVLRSDYARLADDKLGRLIRGLKAAGVANTVALASHEVRRFYGMAGFDAVELDQEGTDAAVLDAARAVLREGPGEGGLLWLHLMGPHDAPGRRMPNRAAYDSRVSRVDELVDAFITDAESIVGRENITFILLADHGESFGAHGVVYHCHSLYEDVVHVPLAVWGGGVSPARSTSPVELTDVAPTIVELLTGADCSWCKGQSLLLEPAADRCALSRGTLLRGELVALACSRWKIIADLTFDFVELYDLSSDGAEERNLVHDSPAERETMEGRLEMRIGR